MNWKKTIDRSACRFGGSILWSPLEGNKRKLSIRRTRVTIRVRKNAKTSFEPCLITLPSLYDEGDFLLELIGNEQKGHYEVTSLDGVPFLHNRNYCFHGIICQGDTFDFDYNRLEVPLASSNKVDDSLPIQSWPDHLSIFLEGETGTGKTTMAKRIHDELHASNQPFVSVNLSAFNPSLIESELFGHERGAFTGAHREKRGAFELAGRGTLFIDEIDSLPLDLQVKVLNFLDDKKFRAVGAEKQREAQCRVIFASGSRIETLVEDRKFRMDLFFRIQSGLKVKLKPLRDNSSLLKSIIEQFEEDNGVSFSKECIELYGKSKWPGNIRQLKSHLWRKYYSGNSSRMICVSKEDEELKRFNSDLIGRGESKVIDLKKVKHEHCEKIYLSSYGSIPLAAKRLNIAQTTLRRILAS